MQIKLFAAATLLSTSVAVAQYTPPTTPAPVSPSKSTVPSNPKPPASQPQTESRPDAKYHKPSGQDSMPGVTHVPKTAPNQGTVENRGTRAADQGKQVDKVAKRKTYTGETGSKADPGTACSTARPTKDGGVDCGTTGDSATLGKTVTKPR